MKYKRFFTLPFHFTHEFVTKREQALRKNLPLEKKPLSGDYLINLLLFFVP